VTTTTVFRKVCVALIALAFVWAPASPRTTQPAGSDDVFAGKGAAPIIEPRPDQTTVTCTDSVAAGVAPVAATTGLPGAHATLYARSGFPTLCPGSTTTVTIAFLNTGSLGWYGNAALGTWGPDPGQDRASVLGGDGTGGSPATSWSHSNRPAVQTLPYVGPGQVMWFQFTVQAPLIPGSFKLGLRPVLEGQEWLEDPNLTFYVLVKADDQHPPQDPFAVAPPVARTYLPATLADGSRSIRVPSLMYHYVSSLPTTDPNMDLRKDLTVSPADFEAMLKYLRDNGYHSITTKDLWWSLDQTAPIPPKPVMLTFDDGYADAYSVVLPLLKAYGMTGTFFVTVNLVDRPGYISRAEVKALAEAGMDVESHAMDHIPLSTKPLSDQVYQMCRSREFLSTWTGTDVRHFAYPSGDYNDASGVALAQCGYLSAYKKAGGSIQSSNAIFLLQRARVRGQQGVGALVLGLQQ
jgi:peptidoglycan/xylan/chitin deacetylase (PgdA/CDA1 family)